MESFEECLLKYRQKLRQALGRIGIATNPGITDDQLLAKVVALVQQAGKPDPFSSYTYVVEHSPNCLSPYMVRMAGSVNGAAVIDKLPPKESRDAIGYGQTFDAAAKDALRKHMAATPIAPVPPTAA